VGVARVRGHSHQSNLDVLESWGSFGAKASIKGSGANNLLLLTNAVISVSLSKISFSLSLSVCHTLTFIKTIAYREKKGSCLEKEIRQGTMPGARSEESHARPNIKTWPVNQDDRG